MHNIKKTPKAKMVFFQSFLYLENICMKILATKLTIRNGKDREKGVGDIWAA
jgi:hypothetical protein